MICTTLNEIKPFKPCDSGWKTLLKHLGKTEADGEPLPLAEILKSNGLDDALWATRCVYKTHKKEMILLSLQIAWTVQHLMKDKRSLAALDVVYRFANGDATEAELQDARSNALAARRNADAAAYPADAAAAYYAAAHAAYAADAAVVAAYYAADAVADAVVAAYYAADAVVAAYYAAAYYAADAVVAAAHAADAAVAADAADAAVVAVAAARKAKRKEIERIFSELVS